MAEVVGPRAVKPQGIYLQRDLAIGFVCAGQGGEDGVDDYAVQQLADAISRGEYDHHLAAIIDGTFKPSAQRAS